MLFSLTLLADRIRPETGLIYVHETQPDKYRNLLLYSEQVSRCPAPEVLYLSDEFPDERDAENRAPGMVCVVKPAGFAGARAQVRQFSGNCLLLGTEAPLADVFNEILSRMFFLRRQMDIFKTAVYTQQSLQKLIEMIFDIMGNPAYLVDSSFKVLAIERKRDMRYLSAAWKRLEDDGYLPFDLVSNLINSGELFDMETNEKPVVVNSRYFYVPFINYNLKQHGKIKGHLFIVGMKKKFLKSDIELAEYLGDFVLELLLRSSRFQNERGDYYEHFMRDMFSGKLMEQTPIRQQMASLGLYPEEYFTVAVLHTSAEHGLSDERIASQLERCSGAKPVFYQDKIAALFPHGNKPDGDAFAESLKQISRELDCEIGVSDTFQGFYDLHTYYVQAEWALTCTSLTSFTGLQPMIRHYGCYAARHVVYGFSRKEQWKALVDPRLLPLHRYDQDTHGELVRTLHIYLLQERSVMEASRLLHIHRNTLAYRMDKIRQMCGFRLGRVE